MRMRALCLGMVVVLMGAFAVSLAIPPSALGLAGSCGGAASGLLSAGGGACTTTATPTSTPTPTPTPTPSPTPTPALVSEAHGLTPASQPTVTVASMAVGNCAVACVDNNNDATLAAITTQEWTPIVVQTATGAAGHFLSLYTHRINGADVTAGTLKLSMINASNYPYTITQWSGVGCGRDTNVVSAQNGNTTPMTLAAYTTVASNALLLDCGVVVAGSGTSAYGAPSSGEAFASQVQAIGGASGGVFLAYAVIPTGGVQASGTVALGGGATMTAYETARFALIP